MRRVAITGIGLVSPLGNDPETFFTNLAHGRSGIVALAAPPIALAGKPMPGHSGKHVGGAVTFDGARHFPAPKLRMLDRVSQFALVAAAQAVSDAGLGFSDADRERAGVFVGTGMGGAQTTEDGYLTLYAEGADRVRPYTVLMAMTNAAASWIGIEYGLLGPNLTYSTACSSSAVAIGEAARRIATGEVDTMIAGGSEAPLNYGTLVAWDAMKTLAAADPNEPGASCKPFARDRTGLVLGEGAAIVVLEDWLHAQQRGCAHSCRVGRLRPLHGRGTHHAALRVGQATAMQRALEAAAMQPGEIGYINAHGTATLANDAVETAAIKRVFGTTANHIPVSSTKSMHGHLLGAAGALELVAAVLALERQIIPPTMHLHVPDPECDLDYVPGEARTGVGLTAVMSNSFAFGGTNAVLICRSAER